MKLKSRSTFAASLIAAVCVFAAGGAHAGGVIFNAAGTLALGVNDLGNLNYTNPDPTAFAPLNSGSTGLAFKMGPSSDGRPAGFYDATSPGCLCEGWGVSANGSVSGYANVASGTGGLSPVSFAATASTATSLVDLAGLSGLTVKHEYSEAAGSGGSLFKAVVTIKNGTAADVSNVNYVRVMDWDVPFTEFSEFVTIKGVPSTTLLKYSNDQGFASADPLAGDPGEIAPGTTNTDFEDSGPRDHGAYFRFDFGTIKAGEEYTFTIFYGATDSERSALAAIGSQGIELYSLGQSGGPDGDPATGAPATFIFGFKGVGGVSLVPTPGSLALVGLGLLGAGVVRRRRA